MECVDRSFMIRSIEPPDMGLRPRHQLPGAEIAGRARKCANAFRGQQARLDRADDAAGDLILDCKDVAEFAVVLLGPMMSAGHRVDQLGADAQPLAGPAHAAFEHIANAELACDLPDIDGAALVDKGRVARDDEQPPDAGQAGDQVLGYAVGEIVLIGIAAHVVKRQHRNGRTIRQRQRAAFTGFRAQGRDRRRRSQSPARRTDSRAWRRFR